MGAIVEPFQEAKLQPSSSTVAGDANKWLLVHRTGWSIADQGVVSVGNFLVNIMLARHLGIAEYGVFSLIFATSLTLQLFVHWLVAYPLTIRLSSAEPDEAARLSMSSVVISAMLCIPLGTIIAIALLLLHRPELIIPGLLWFVFWQVQQATRRALLADLAYREAMMGDMLNSIGQAVLLATAIIAGVLSLGLTLLCMASAAAMGAIFQLRQRPISLVNLERPHRWLSQNSGLGGWSLVAALLSSLRVYGLFWLLAVVSGPAAVGSLQAALNVFYGLNPIQLGLGNLIPQMAARAYAIGDRRSAWICARPYMLFAAPPTFAYLAVVLMFPSLIVQLFYGSGDSYHHLTGLFPPLAVLTGCMIVVEMIIYYFLGLRETRLTAGISVVGFLAVIVIFILTLGLYGSVYSACLSLAGGELVRLGLTAYCLRKYLGVDNMTQDGRVRVFGIMDRFLRRKSDGDLKSITIEDR
jgi:O-antigen/teichoic acid export membrane protein